MASFTGPVETRAPSGVGDALGFARVACQGDSKVKAMIEGRGSESGAWRGEVERRRLLAVKRNAESSDGTVPGPLARRR